MHQPITPAGVPQGEAIAVRESVREFLRPLLRRLAGQLDVRLVRTMRDVVEAMLRLRTRPSALWLTELETLVVGAARAPAGVKRVSRLLRAAGWSADDLEHWLLEQADGYVAASAGAGGEVGTGTAPLVLLDESVAEKPESCVAQGLCRVRSSQARRLARRRPGFGAGPPPTRPITVPGLHWLAATVIAHPGSALLACCRWWSPAAPGARPDADEATGYAQGATEAQLVRDLFARWGRQVLLVADRGFARRAFLDLLLDAHARFVIRWPKRYRLVLRTTPALPARTAINAWRLTAGKKPGGHETVWDARTRTWLTVAFFAVPVWLTEGPGAAQPL